MRVTIPVWVDRNKEARLRAYIERRRKEWEAYVKLFENK